MKTLADKIIINFSRVVNAPYEKLILSNSKSLLKIMAIAFFMMASPTFIYAQWDSYSSTAGSGYTNWGNNVISLTDTTTSSGTCQGSAIHETSSLYNPTAGAPFSQCFRVFFGCPGNDQIGTAGNPYTDFNGDGMAFTFWKSTATWNFNGTTCGGGLGYDNAISDLKAITIEFDTYSSIGGDNVDPNYGGGAPGSGINDEIAIHKDAETRDEGRLTATNAGNLEDGKGHDVCITYTPGTHILTVSIDGVTRLTYDMGATYNLETYFGNIGLRQSWSAGKYGANNLQTVGLAGADLQGEIGAPFCPGTLPVKLLKFTGELVDNNVLLNWTTVNEIDNEKFIIERSNNYYDWHSIGQVAGAGNSSSPIPYSFIDHAPLKGMSYYRLRQIDYNKISTVSNVVPVNADDENKIISIAPNPFEDEVIIKSTIKGEMNISIYDVVGRSVYESNTKTEDGMVAIHADLPSGAYLITIKTDDLIEQRTIIKK